MQSGRRAQTVRHTQSDKRQAREHTYTHRIDSHSVHMNTHTYTHDQADTHTHTHTHTQWECNQSVRPAGTYSQVDTHSQT